MTWLVFVRRTKSRNCSLIHYLCDPRSPCNSIENNSTRTLPSTSPRKEKRPKKCSKNWCLDYSCIEISCISDMLVNYDCASVSRVRGGPNCYVGGLQELHRDLIVVFDFQRGFLESRAESIANSKFLDFITRKRARVPTCIGSVFSRPRWLHLFFDFP